MVAHVRSLFAEEVELHNAMAAADAELAAAREGQAQLKEQMGLEERRATKRKAEELMAAEEVTARVPLHGAGAGDDSRHAAGDMQPM